MQPQWMQRLTNSGESLARDTDILHVDMNRFAFVGPGRVGLALGWALTQVRSDLFLRYVGRHPNPPAHPLFTSGDAEYTVELDRALLDAQVVILTVPDAIIPQIADELAGLITAQSKCIVIHCSGALDAEVLDPLADQGCFVGTLHPFLSIPRSLGQPGQFDGAFFTLSGAVEAVTAARRMVDWLGGRAVEVPTGRRPMYHAASVLASNYLVVLLNEATQIMVQCGMGRREATEMLASLASGVIDNVGSLGMVDALTGPLARGDVETVDSHLRALGSDQAKLYAALGRQALVWIGDRVDPKDRSRMERLFEEFA